MPKILKFTQFSLRDFLVAAGPAALAIAVTCLLAYWLVDPAPPSQVTLSTGQENSAYEAFGKKYAAALERFHVHVALKPSQGSQENLARLHDPESGVDIAFVQSGSSELEDAEQKGLVSLGSLFTEPVWLFLRDAKSITKLTQLRGMRINVGPEGSGVPALFRKLLSVNGVEPSELRLGALENTPATVELLAGRIDGLVFSSAPDAPLIQMLLQTPGIKLFDFALAEAYTRRFPFLSHVVLPRGIVDLGRDLPRKDYHLIAPTATLVARADLHPAVVDLFVQAAVDIHGGAGWFHRKGDFPTASYTEIPVSRAAQRFYKEGPPLLRRYLPFWLANFFERMWVVVVALGALILPLSRIIPPLYVWKVRSRVYRWYGQLRAVEQAIEDVPRERQADVYPAQLKRLNDIEDRVNRISIPLSFADELYGLRSHINFVRRRVTGLMRAEQ
ncbi:TAXI family TRAP transporter solute-binding subunit [Noviherbaspirillum sp. UKPF54]|uniref:TAXI family TRAP transporter solute-binding subunit n=1 Tax=Noviherbaspirillum sp. UKPF54 TaxID=2601898 RepID=UPI0011B1C4AD|nr:TAXI family TRAP transporter solute-binding subunit [Noviherbaspirillum sp. UKPF54]QDZ28466.1 C4-dicarboxylate ABC transporter substrate-binding protein [Noviherbaspirillum sp. UKPF54]